MKNLPTRTIPVPWALALQGLLLVPIGALIIWWWYAEDAKYLGLAGGLLGGLVVYWAGLLMDYFAWNELRRFQEMGVHNLLENRHDKSYYRPIVESASERIKVLGASCSRFIDDFLDVDSDDKVLIDGLRKHKELTVELLVPDEEHMTETAASRFQLSCDKVTRLRTEFPNRFDIRRFSHEARHSFVVADNHLIAGPIFEETESKHAPAVHVTTSTPFGDKYLTYFDNLWADCAPDHADVVEN